MEVRWVGGVADRVRVLCIVMVHEGPICDGILGRVRMMVWADRVLSFEAKFEVISVFVSYETGDIDLTSRVAVFYWNLCGHDVSLAQARE